jgi:hypothetical protein
MVAKVFNTYTFTITAHANISDDKSQAQMLAENKLGEIRESVRQLVSSVFKEGKLTHRITGAQQDNDKNM